MDDLVVAIISGLIPVIGVSLTAIVSLIVFKRQSWLKTVSESRNHWLNEFREEFSIIVGAIKIIQINNYECLFIKSPDYTKRTEIKDRDHFDLIKMIYKAEIAKAKLITRLNTNKVEGNEYNFALKRILYDLKFEKEYVDKIELEPLQEMVDIVLENEWKKIKREAKGYK